MLTNIQYKPDKIIIHNDATATLPDLNKRLVRIDHFVSSPRLQEVVKTEVSKMEEIDEILKAL